VEEGKDTYPAKEIETNYDVSYNRNAVRMEGREGGGREEEKERKRERRGDGQRTKNQIKLFDNQSKGIIHISERGFEALAWD